MTWTNLFIVLGVIYGGHKLLPVGIIGRQVRDLCWYYLKWKFGGRVKKSVSPLQYYGDVSARCWPSECDLWMHMNNCQYNRWCEAARLQFYTESGIGKYKKRHKIKSGLSSVSIRFRREIKPFTKFKVVTRISGWDKRTVYIEHLFLVGDFIHAHAISTMKMTKASLAKGFSPAMMLQGMDPKGQYEEERLHGGIESWQNLEAWSSKKCTEAATDDAKGR